MASEDTGDDRRKALEELVMQHMRALTDAVLRRLEAIPASSGDLTAASHVVEQMSNLIFDRIDDLDNAINSHRTTQDHLVRAVDVIQQLRDRTESAQSLEQIMAILNTLPNRDQQARINELEEATRAETEKRAELQGQLRSAEERLTQANNSLQTETTERGRIQGQLGSVQEQLATSQTSLNTANTALATEKEGHTTAKANLKTTQNQLEESQTSLENANTALTTEQEGHTRAKANLETTQNQLEESRQNLSNTNTALATEREDHTETKAQLETARNKHEESRQNLSEVNATLTTEQEGHNKTKAQLETAQRQLGESRLHLSNVNNSLNDQRRDNNTLQEQLDSAQAETTAVRNELTDQKANNGKLEGERNTAQADAVTARSELADQTKDNGRLEGERNTAQAQATTARSELADQTRDNGRLEGERNTAQAQATTARNDLADQRTINDTLQGQLNTAQADVTTARNQLDDQTRDNGRLEGERNTAQAQATTARNDLADQRTINDTLRGRLESAQTEAATANRLYNVETRRCGLLRGENASARAQAISANDSLVAERRQIAMLQATIQTLQTQVTMRANERGGVMARNELLNQQAGDLQAQVRDLTNERARLEREQDRLQNTIQSQRAAAVENVRRIGELQGQSEISQHQANIATERAEQAVADRATSEAQMQATIDRLRGERNRYRDQLEQQEEQSAITHQQTAEDRDYEAEGLLRERDYYRNNFTRAMLYGTDQTARLLSSQARLHDVRAERDAANTQLAQINPTIANVNDLATRLNNLQVGVDQIRAHIRDSNLAEPASGDQDSQQQGAPHQQHAAHSQQQQTLEPQQVFEQQRSLQSHQAPQPQQQRPAQSQQQSLEQQQRLQLQESQQQVHTSDDDLYRAVTPSPSQDAKRTYSQRASTLTSPQGTHQRPRTDNQSLTLLGPRPDAQLRVQQNIPPFDNTAHTTSQPAPSSLPPARNLFEPGPVQFGFAANTSVATVPHEAAVVPPPTTHGSSQGGAAPPVPEITPSAEDTFVPEDEEIEQTDDDYTSPNDLGVRQTFVIIDVSTAGRIQNSVLSAGLRAKYVDSFEAWKSIMVECVNRETRERTRKPQEVSHVPQCFIQQQNRRPGPITAKGRAADRWKWSWPAHDINQSCPNANTQDRGERHQCLKVVDEGTLWLLNPLPEDFDNQAMFDRQNHRQEVAEAAEAARKAAQGDDAQGGGAQGGGAQAPGAQGGAAQGGAAQGGAAQGAGAQGPGAQGPGAQGPGAQGPGAQGPGAQAHGAKAPVGGKAAENGDARAGDDEAVNQPSTPSRKSRFIRALTDNRVVRSMSSISLGRSSSPPVLAPMTTTMPESAKSARLGLSKSSHDQASQASRRSRFSSRPSSYYAPSTAGFVSNDGTNTARQLKSVSGSQRTVRSRSTAVHSRNGSNVTTTSPLPQLNEESPYSDRGNVDHWRRNQVSIPRRPHPSEFNSKHPNGKDRRQ